MAFCDFSVVTVMKRDHDGDRHNTPSILAFLITFPLPLIRPIHLVYPCTPGQVGAHVRGISDQ